MNQYDVADPSARVFKVSLTIEPRRAGLVSLGVRSRSFSSSNR